MATTFSQPAGFEPAVAANDARLVMVNQVAWGAVFAGAAAALVGQLVLNMIGLGIGVSMINPGGDNPAASTLSIGAGLWWVASGILASAAGGFLAGRLSGKPSATTAGYHGLVSWTVATIVVFYLLTTAVGGLLGGAFGAVTGALGGAGRVAGGAIQTTAQTAAPSLAQAADPLSGIETQMRGATGGQDPAALRDVAISAVKAALTGDAAQRQQAGDRAAEALAKAQGIPVAQAREKVTQYEAQYSQALEVARQKALHAAKVTAATVSRGALLGAFALILGALAAFFGGRAGAVRRLDARNRAV